MDSTYLIYHWLCIPDYPYILIVLNLYLVTTGVVSKDDVRNKEDNEKLDSKSEKENEEKEKKKSSRRKRSPIKFSEDEFKPKVTMPHNQIPTYYIGGVNGVGM